MHTMNAAPSWALTMKHVYSLCLAIHIFGNKVYCRDDSVTNELFFFVAFLRDSKIHTSAKSHWYT